MNKTEAKKEIEKLREQINYHNYQYYVENNPVVSDYEYDMLLKKLEALEQEFLDYTIEGASSSDHGFDTRAPTHVGR